MISSGRSPSLLNKLTNSHRNVPSVEVFEDQECFSVKKTTVELNECQYIDSNGQLLLRFREFGAFYLEERTLMPFLGDEDRLESELYKGRAGVSSDDDVGLAGCIVYCTFLDQTFNEMQEKVEEDCRYLREIYPDLPIVLVGCQADRRQQEEDHVTTDQFRDVAQVPFKTE